MRAVTPQQPILAWHFGGTHLGYDDGRRIVIGRRQRFRPTKTDRSLAMCECGMHASRRILDALAGARGDIIYRVEVSGQILEEPDKLCAEYRKPLWRINGRELLRRFARLCALDVVGNWQAPEVVLRWLKTGDESLRKVAYDAIDSAVDKLVSSTPHDTAYYEAYYAAQSAVCAMAHDAADAAAGYAADFAASDAIRRKQNRRLLAMVYAEKRRCARLR
jgi:hypothetical protein